MKIVIDIPEEKYQTILNHTEEILSASSFIEPKYLYGAILNGTPLPKGYGDLIDRDKLKTHYVGTDIGTDLRVYLVPTIDEAPTILEADKKESEENK